MSDVDREKWDKLIEEHYLSACKVNPNYSKKFTREEMKDWWYQKLEVGLEKDILEFIEGSTFANNNGFRYHPV
jgi:hypothetical protein